MRVGNVHMIMMSLKNKVDMTLMRVGKVRMTVMSVDRVPMTECPGVLADETCALQFFSGSRLPISLRCPLII